MTKKKVIRNFWEIDEMFLGKCRNFVRRRVKKVVQKFRLKFGPFGPPSWIRPLDPLVVRGFLPSAIAVSRLRRLIPISPPKQKIPAPLAPQTKNPRTATVYSVRLRSVYIICLSLTLSAKADPSQSACVCIFDVGSCRNRLLEAASARNEEIRTQQQTYLRKEVITADHTFQHSPQSIHSFVRLLFILLEMIRE